MRWVLDQDDLDYRAMAARLDELRNHAHAVPVRRADGSYDILVEVDPVTLDRVPPPPPIVLTPGVKAQVHQLARAAVESCVDISAPPEDLSIVH